MPRNLVPPPSNVSGPMGLWMRDLHKLIDGQPNFSLASFGATETPDSRVTGTAGDLAMNLGSGATNNRLWMLGGTPASSRTDRGWVPVLGGAAGGGLPSHAANHASGGIDPVTLAQTQITNLVADLALKAPLASPTFSGTVTLTGATVAGAPTWSSTQTLNTSGTAATVTGATQAAITTAANLTTIGTLVAGAVPASLVTAGTLGSGNFALSGTAVLTATTVTATTLNGTLGTATQNSVTTMTGLTTIGTLVAGAVPASLVTADTFPGGAYNFTGATTLTGGAGNMTIQSGTGASRTLTFKTTTSGSAVQTVLTLNTDASAVFAGAVSGITTLATSSTINSQTISATANFTGTLATAGAPTFGVAGSSSVTTATVNISSNTAFNGTLMPDHGLTIYNSSTTNGSFASLQFVLRSASAAQASVAARTDSASNAVLVFQTMAAGVLSAPLTIASAIVTVDAATTAVQALTATTMAGTDASTITTSLNGDFKGWIVQNTNTGNAAIAQIAVGNSSVTNAVGMAVFGANYATSGLAIASSGYIYSNRVNGLSIVAEANSVVRIGTNNTLAATFHAGGDLDLVGGISATTGAFSGAVSLGNTVAAAAAVASTHKVTCVIGGTTYYLLVSNV